MAFAEDFAPFIDVDDFATEAEWTSLVVGTRTTVYGIFDNGYGAAFDGLVGAQQPTFLCAEADVAQAAQDDPLAIGGVEYTVTNVEPDGTGMVTLRLRKV